MTDEYAGEIDRLAHAARALGGAGATVEAFRTAFREIIAAMPVYRCYVDAHGASAEDRRWLKAAFDGAAIDDPALAAFLWRLLAAEGPPPLAPKDPAGPTRECFRTDAQARRDLILLFQQVSGPAMAKGLEDTVFFRYVPLLGLNEVGGAAEPRPLAPEAFHAANRDKVRTAPDELVAGSTHDTKRGEDARARLVCLTSDAEAWDAALTRWRIGEQTLPGTSVEHCFYQTLLGVWPPGLRGDDAAGLAALAARLRPAMLKAVREAKERTNWTRTDPAYEAALAEFIETRLDPGRSQSFLRDFALLAERVGFWGALTSLSATLLRLTVPGVPDIFQGSEGWNLSLVDPDNRRPVDFDAARRRMRTSIQACAALPSSWHDGSVKTGLTREILALRRCRPGLFSRCGYRPLQPKGDRADCLVAFAREDASERVVVLAPRFWPRLWPEGAARPIWGGTSIVVPPGRYRNRLTGAAYAADGRTSVLVEELLRDFPCAVLATEI
jgi:(1->4)-alpha-D-glucan 1-alpha-D-glucosylmutase